MQNTFIHANAAEGAWFKLSLFEQLGRIGSEVGRACRWRKKADISERNVSRRRNEATEDADISERNVSRRRSITTEDDGKIFQGAVERALELFDLTLEDPRWRGRRRELARVREVFCDAVFGAKEYGSSLDDLEKYFYPFAFAARAIHP